MEPLMAKALAYVTAHTRLLAKDVIDDCLLIRGQNQNKCVGG